MVRREQQPASANPSGLGLGVYIAHQIVTTHGGTITVHSAAGEGTTFTVRVPRSRDDGLGGATKRERRPREDERAPKAHR